MYTEEQDVVKDQPHHVPEDLPPSYHDDPGVPAENIPIAQVTGPSGPIHDFLWLSILTCIFCCWPLGVAAIVFSCQAREGNARYDYGWAHRNSKQALRFSIASMISGVIIITGYIALLLAQTTPN